MIFSAKKICKTCNQDKNLDDFYRKKDSKNGYFSKCKICTAIYYEKNKEEKRKYQIEYKKLNKEKLAIYDKEYHLLNKQKIYDKNKQTKIKNSDKYKSLYCIKSAKKRLKIKSSIPSWADKDKIKEIYDFASEFRSYGISVDVDHIVPLNSKIVNGFHTHENLRVCLSSFNRSKGNRILEILTEQQWHKT